jgi:hypothetical protein
VIHCGLDLSPAALYCIELPYFFLSVTTVFPNGIDTRNFVEIIKTLWTNVRSDIIHTATLLPGFDIFKKIRSVAKKICVVFADHGT